MKFDKALEIVLITMAANGETSISFRKEGIGQLQIQRSDSDAAANNRKWTEKDNAYLCKHCDSSTSEEVARVLRRSPSAVRMQASKLGLKFKSRERGLSAEVQHYLRSMSAVATPKKLAQATGISLYAVYRFIRTNDLTPYRKAWGPEMYAEVTRLIHERKTRKQICRQLDITMNRLNHELYRHQDKFVGLQLRRKKK